jgi:S-adenosylmethionine uptake transporter
MTPLLELAGKPRSNLAGVGLMLAGAFLFSVNDALGKWLLADYSVGELLLVRSAAGLILLAPLIRQAGIAGFRSAPRPGSKSCA